MDPSGVGITAPPTHLRPRGRLPDWTVAVLAHDQERALGVWEVGTGERVSECTTAPGEGFYPVFAPAPDGPAVATASRGGALRIWVPRPRTPLNVSLVPGHPTGLAGDERHLVRRAADPVVLTRTEGQAARG